MVIRNVTVNDCTPETIVIGRRGTFETMQIVFDLTYLIENYGDGTAVLALKRSQDSSAYPAVAAQDGNTLTWVVSEVDTYYIGAGVCQLMWYVNDGLAKTIIYPMVVMKDILSTAEDPPDGYENWIEHLTDLGAETLQNAHDAAQSASDAESAKDDAVTAKEAAETAANRAETAASNAGNSASSAANSAGVASQKAIDAALSANSASSSASSASGYAGSASASASSASESATSASNSASSASTSAQTATTKANEASSSASSAAGSAQTATTKAGEAATSATNASTSASQASTSASNASTSATNAAGSATTATNQAGIATTKAGEAAQSATAASEAQTAAETAQGKAEDAQDAAETAAQSIQSSAAQIAQNTQDISTLNNALSSLVEEVNDPVTGLATKTPVIINSASGDIASFPDGADSMPIKSLVASIEPVQDLHGYDNPWPAGGGKNLLNTIRETATKSGLTFTRNADGTYTVNGTSTETGIFPITNESDIGYDSLSDIFAVQAGTEYILNGAPAGYGAKLYLQFLVSGSGQEPVDYGNGVQFSFTQSEIDTKQYRIAIRYLTGQTFNNVLVKPMIRLASVTDATFAPYSNECPINGHTGLTVGRVGKNWLAKPFTYFSDTSSVLQDCFFVKAGSYLFSFLSSSATSWRFGIRMIDANGTLLSSQEYNPNANKMFWNTNNNMWLTGANGSTKYTTITIAKDCYIRIVFALGDTTASSTFTGCQLELGSTQTDVEPYTGTTIHITFPETIYGGSDEVIVGALTSELASVDLADRTWLYIAPYFRTEISDAKIVNALGQPVTEILSSQYKPVQKLPNTMSNGEFCVTGTQYSIRPYLCIRDDRYTDATTFKSAMAGQTVLYTLATPIEYTLSANELNTLYGQNNVWTDVGEVSVDYPADTKLYVDNKIAEAIANALNA